MLAGATGVVTSITSTLGNSFAALSMDADYQRSRKLAAARHRTAAQKLTHGGESLLRGVYEGATGLVMQPFRGTQVGASKQWQSYAQADLCHRMGRRKAPLALLRVSARACLVCWPSPWLV